MGFQRAYLPFGKGLRGQRPLARVVDSVIIINIAAFYAVL